MKQNNSRELSGYSFPYIYHKSYPKMTKHALMIFLYFYNFHTENERNSEQVKSDAADASQIGDSSTEGPANHQGFY